MNYVAVLNTTDRIYTIINESDIKTISNSDSVLTISIRNDSALIYNKDKPGDIIITVSDDIGKIISDFMVLLNTDVTKFTKNITFDKVIQQTESEINKIGNQCKCDLPI